MQNTPPDLQDIDQAWIIRDKGPWPIDLNLLTGGLFYCDVDTPYSEIIKGAYCKTPEDALDSLLHTKRYNRALRAHAREHPSRSSSSSSRARP